MDQQVIEVISEKLSQRIANKKLSLPMLPQVTTQVLSLVNDVDSDAAALAKLIQSDQALAGHVMRIANSAAYSPMAKMTSLQQASARLGMQNIADIAMAATMGPKLFQVPGFEDMVSEIWKASLATAVWAREIARQGRRNVESTFLCGLLCQIGKPVVLQTVLEIAKDLNESADPQDVSQLIERFQVEVGSSLAEHWQLPVAVGNTIRFIDIEGPAEEVQDIVDSIKAARIFSAITLTDRHYDLDLISTDPHIVETNLYSDDIQQLLEKTDAIHETVEALLL
ncbi:HDOD domain-containing protein [bacterium AH-315-K03]|nr:HDOD domain-containing protein [bacterium AH-315-K03]